MATQPKTLIDLEHKFWQSIMDQDADTATQMLCEPSLMISSHGAMKFDHAAYRKMAMQGSMVLTSFEFSNVDVVFPSEATAIVTYTVKQSMAPRGKTDGTVQEMNDSSTWVHTGGRWRCAMHTETPIEKTPATH
ncbi:MAG: nuclear transport factor 2 family protein [Gammaproteobacteria bacterium]